MVKRTRLNLKHLPLQKLVELLRQYDELRPALDQFRAEQQRLAKEHDDELWRRRRRVEANRSQVEKLRHEYAKLSGDLDTVAAEQRTLAQGIHSRRYSASGWSFVLHPGSINWRGVRYPAEVYLDVDRYEAGERRIAELINARTAIGNRIIEATRLDPPALVAVASPSSMMEIRQDKTTYRFDLASIDESELRAEIEQKKKQKVQSRSRVDTIREKARAYDNKHREQASLVKKGLRGQLESDPYCPYCGEGLRYEDAHADHIYPLAFGGHSIAQNMVFVCSECNIRKGTKTLREFIGQCKLDERMVHARLEIHGKKF